MHEQGRENRSVGELLKTCRLRAGLTQEEMAKRLGYDRSVISRLENGEIEAGYWLVRQWCAITQGIDLMALDLAGDREAWKKLVKFEAFLKKLKVDLETVGQLRKNQTKERQALKHAASTAIRALRRRIRSH